MASKVNLREAKDDQGRNALHLAAAKGHLDVCRFLVEGSGLDVNSVSVEGGRPVHLAAAGGSESVLRYLLDRGADPAIPDSRGTTPLHHAAERGHCEAVRLLLSKGVDVKAIDNVGTPLHSAASQGQDQTLKILLEHGADVNKVVNELFTPLFTAIFRRYLGCTKLLVEAGADVNFISPSGPIILMALMGVINDGLTDIIKVLLEAGADPNIAAKDGRIPITWAAVYEYRELVELLYPWTQPIPYLPDWSVDGILRSMNFLSVDGLICLKVSAAVKEPDDATLYANMSICWLRLSAGMEALVNARKCKTKRPGWSKAWYREGAALSFLNKHKEAAEAFTQALKLEPLNDEIKKALREAMEAMRSAARSG